MLSARLTSSFKVVSMYDPATLDIPTKIMTRYVQKRDFTLIEKQIALLKSPPTIFKAQPLQAEKEYLADNLAIDGLSNYWQIFKHHVRGAENFCDDRGNPIIVLDDDGTVDNSCKKMVPRDIVQEIASVIIGKANESTKPFLMPDTWLQTRIRSQSLLATTANLENASEKDTE